MSGYGGRFSTLMLTTENCLNRMTTNVLSSQLLESRLPAMGQSSATERTVELSVQPVLDIQSLTRVFPGAPSPAVNEISFTLQKGELLGLLGPSGCGKTTLLRLIAGFEKPQNGSISLEGIHVAGGGAWFPPERRGIGMVFQDYALFPHLTVAKNVAFGLRTHRKPLFRFGSFSKATRDRISEVLALVGLDGMEHRYPHQLSGGQQQRVALARALAPNPQMVLLDEPLSNLDAKVRLQLRQDVRDILKAAGATGIFVTHDQEEALSICDRVAVMRHGNLEQIGTPQELYQTPASRFVAEFVVQANFIPAQRSGVSPAQPEAMSQAEASAWDTELGALQSRLPQTTVHPEGRLTEDCADLMVRQEDLVVTPDPNSDLVVCDRQFLGRENRYGIQLPSGQVIVARVPAAHIYAVGETVRVAIAAPNLQVFPAQSALTMGSSKPQRRER